MKNVPFVVEPTRSEMDESQGAVLLEFGVDWCPHCQAAQPLIAKALAGRQDVKHLRIEDGKGKVLGRTFSVKIWPTLIFIKNGQEIDRLIRPVDQAAVDKALYSL